MTFQLFPIMKTKKQIRQELKEGWNEYLKTHPGANPTESLMEAYAREMAGRIVIWMLRQDLPEDSEDVPDINDPVFQNFLTTWFEEQNQLEHEQDKATN